MADALREEIAELGTVEQKPGETAMGKLTSAIRRLVDAGDITRFGRSPAKAMRFSMATRWLNSTIATAQTRRRNWPISIASALSHKYSANPLIMR